MASTIGSNDVTLSENWGAIKFYDYTFNGARMDFQDLMVAVSEKRAVSVEREVTPMTTRIRARNTYLDQLGNALSELTKIQAGFGSNDKGQQDMGGWMTNTTGDLLRYKLGFSCTIYYASSDRPDADERAGFYFANYESGSSKYSANKMTIEGMIQKVKSTIDGLNNESQTDMSRLQSLVDRRDESYSTATNLMTAISDTRSNLIRNL
jgi:hypothetical protein